MLGIHKFDPVIRTERRRGPFGDVAVHIVESPRVREIMSRSFRKESVVAETPILRNPVVVVRNVRERNAHAEVVVRNELDERLIGKIRVARKIGVPVAKVKGRRRPGATCALPFFFRRQTERSARLFRKPLAKRGRLVP